MTGSKAVEQPLFCYKTYEIAAMRVKAEGEMNAELY